MTTVAEDQTQQRPYEWIKTNGNGSTQMFLGKIWNQKLILCVCVLLLHICYVRLSSPK